MLTIEVEPLIGEALESTAGGAVALANLLNCYVRVKWNRRYYLTDVPPHSAVDRVMAVWRGEMMERQNSRDQE